MDRELQRTQRFYWNCTENCKETVKDFLNNWQKKKVALNFFFLKKTSKDPTVRTIPHWGTSNNRHLKGNRHVSWQLVSVKTTKKQGCVSCKLFPIGQNPKQDNPLRCLIDSFHFLQRLQVQSQRDTIKEKGNIYKEINIMLHLINDPRAAQTQDRNFCTVILQCVNISSRGQYLHILRLTS